MATKPTDCAGRTTLPTMSPPVGRPCPGVATVTTTPASQVAGALKTELVHPRRFQTRQQAIEQIADYIELFYNRQRFQAQLSFWSLAVFEQRHMRISVLISGH